MHITTHQTSLLIVVSLAMAYLKGSVGDILVDNPVRHRSSSIIQVGSKKYGADHMTNITPYELSLLEKRNYLVPNHPINIVRKKLYSYFEKNHVDVDDKPLFATFDDLSPVTTPEKNFDNCLIPEGYKSEVKMRESSSTSTPCCAAT